MSGWNDPGADPADEWDRQDAAAEHAQNLARDTQLENRTHTCAHAHCGRAIYLMQRPRVDAKWVHRGRHNAECETGGTIATPKTRGADL